MNETASALAWREEWIANIRRQAHLLYAHHCPPWVITQGLGFYVDSTVEVPLILPPVRTTVSTAFTDALRPVKRSATDVLSLAQLGQVSIQSTRDLASEASLWFFQKYLCLPTCLYFSPLRCMQSQQYFPLNEACACIGLYTIEIECESGLATDIVRIENKVARMSILYL